MAVLGFRTDIGLFDKFIINWCKINNKRYTFIECSEQLLCHDFLIINPLIFQQQDWHKFIFLHEKLYDNIEVIIVYQNIERFLRVRPKVPANSDVLWIDNPKKEICTIDDYLNRIF